MKTHLLIILMCMLSLPTLGQQSTIKAGGNFNAEILSHKLDKANYVGCEVSYERVFCKRLSLSATFNYAKVTYRYTSEIPELQVFYNNERWLKTYLNLIPEARYYVKPSGSGFFIHLGVPVIYVIEKHENLLPMNEYSGKQYGFAICTIGGLGIKHPISNRFGVEMMLGVSPSMNLLGVDYGTSGFVKSAFKLFYTLDKPKAIKS